MGLIIQRPPPPARRHHELPDRRGHQRRRGGDHRRQPQQLQPLRLLAGRRPHLGPRVEGTYYDKLRDEMTSLIEDQGGNSRDILLPSPLAQVSSSKVHKCKLLK